MIIARTHHPFDYVPLLSHILSQQGDKHVHTQSKLESKVCKIGKRMTRGTPTGSKRGRSSVSSVFATGLKDMRRSLLMTTRRKSLAPSSAISKDAGPLAVVTMVDSKFTPSKASSPSNTRVAYSIETALGPVCLEESLVESPFLTSVPIGLLQLWTEVWERASSRIVRHLY